MNIMARLQAWLHRRLRWGSCPLGCEPGPPDQQPYRRHRRLGIKPCPTATDRMRVYYRHQQRERRTRRGPTPRRLATCEHCGHIWPTAHPTARCCSRRRCRNAYKRRWAANHRPGPIIATCRHCGRTWEPRNPRARYCSLPDCRRASNADYRRRKAARGPLPRPNTGSAEIKGPASFSLVRL